MCYDVLFYDLISMYFESDLFDDFCDKCCFGYSWDKCLDCV